MNCWPEWFPLCETPLLATFIVGLLDCITYVPFGDCFLRSSDDGAPPSYLSACFLTLPSNPWRKAAEEEKSQAKPVGVPQVSARQILPRNYMPVGAVHRLPESQQRKTFCPNKAEDGISLLPEDIKGPSDLDTKPREKMQQAQPASNS